MIHTLFRFTTLLGQTFERRIYIGQYHATLFDEWGFYPKQIIIKSGKCQGHYELVADLDGEAHYQEVIGLIMEGWE